MGVVVSYKITDNATVSTICRLIELAANYYDLESLPDGEMKQALRRGWAKRAGKDVARGDGSDRNKKKKKKKEGTRDQKRRKGDGKAG